MNTEARDKAIQEIFVHAIGLTQMSIGIQMEIRIAMNRTYEAGYAEQPRDAVSDEYDKGFTDGMREGRRAARDEAIRILSARQENDYEA